MKHFFEKHCMKILAVVVIIFATVMFGLFMTYSKGSSDSAVFGLNMEKEKENDENDIDSSDEEGFAYESDGEISEDLTQDQNDFNPYDDTEYNNQDGSNTNSTASASESKGDAANSGTVSRDAYISNPNLFQCSWASYFNVPAWMTDYNEKLAAYADTDGRMMSIFHKGDTIYYPENSIEAIISAIRMGADAVEVDLCLTKDNVVVLMHSSADLSSTTDWNIKQGRNGLPTSKKVADWTLSELRQLRLKMSNGTITDYVIPTFEEALRVCNGRTKLMLDKPDAWDWNLNVYPLIKKCAAWDTCIPPRTYSFSVKNSIASTIKASSDKNIYAFYDISSSNCVKWESIVNTMKSGQANYIAFWAARCITDDMITEASPYLSKIAGTIRIFGQNHTSAGGNETTAYWNTLHKNGVNIVLTDKGINLQKYIAENFGPTAY